MESKLLHAFSKASKGLAETNEALAIIFEELAAHTREPYEKGPTSTGRIAYEKKEEPVPAAVPEVAAEEKSKPKRKRRTKAEILLEQEEAKQAEEAAQEDAPAASDAEPDAPISADREYVPTVDELKDQARTVITKYGEDVKGRVRSALEDLGYANLTALDTSGSKEDKLAFAKALNGISNEFAAKA